MKGTNDRVRRVLAVADESGWEVSRTRNNHLRMTHPKTRQTVFAPATPSEYRGVKNVIAELRRKSRAGV